MRGLCALIVVLYHCAYALNSPTLIGHGWLSVDMFFVLSGFVISLVYEGKLKAGFGFAEFVRARARRLLPVQMIGTVLGAVSLQLVYWESGPAGWAFAVAVITALLLVPISWTPFGSLFPSWRGIFPVNSPIWSLQGEWIINVIYGRILYAWPLRALVAAAGLSAAYVFVIALTDLGWASAETGIGRAALGFILGVIVHRLHQKPGFQSLPQISPGVIFALWFLISCLPAGGEYPGLQSIPASLVSAMLIALLVRGERPMGKVFLYLGRISYPLYATHFAIVNLTILCFSGPARHSAIWAAPMLASALLLATAVDRLTSPLRAMRTRPAVATV
jgi:peptidoglycan/LPS O-acetylase OafA/YrhL